MDVPTATRPQAAAGTSTITRRSALATRFELPPPIVNLGLVFVAQGVVDALAEVSDRLEVVDGGFEVALARAVPGEGEVP